MRALSLHQPWAALVAQGDKHFETRSWPPPSTVTLPFWVAIHATRRKPNLRKLIDNPKTGEHFYNALIKAGVWIQETLHDWDINDKPLVLGAVLAVARVSSVDRTECLRPTPREAAFGDYTPGRWAWGLGEVRPLEQPVPCRGFHKLWTLPPDVEAAVWDQAGRLD